ncbi:MAG: hypothetical protein ABS55_06240 [Lautropia sp. SCN 70-15]|mgnify:CR=1 FL=1|nr:MAG: hypothetical protein ABS55_06240 [Lautropia sp. SCN 70-15]
MIEARDIVITHGAAAICTIEALRVAPGDHLGIAGRSGAGKSSLLRLAAGLARPTSGLWRNTFERPAIVFQQPTLLPWRTVLQNLVIPLRSAGLGRAEAAERARHWLEQVGLGGWEQAWPAMLSGGMAQRAALARALAIEPDLLLLDEPFSSLDPELRAGMAQLCRDWLDMSGAALLCISHQPREIADLASRCLVLRNGAGLWLERDGRGTLDTYIAQALGAPDVPSQAGRRET